MAHAYRTFWHCPVILVTNICRLLREIEPVLLIRKQHHPGFGGTLYDIPIAGSNHIRLNTMLQSEDCDGFSTAASPTSHIHIVQKHIQCGFELHTICYSHNSHGQLMLLKCYVLMDQYPVVLLWFHSQSGDEKFIHDTYFLSRQLWHKGIKKNHWYCPVNLITNT